MDSMLAELQEIFRDVIDDPTLVLTPDSNASNVKDWDSLTHINLMTAVANHYKVKFKLSELQDLKNVGDLMTLLAKKLEAKQAGTK
jgi:acyl carrier protein